MKLRCPICSLPLQDGGKSLFCERGHCFDRAREGYWNLLHRPSAHAHGDDKSMLDARRRFLETGAYAPLREAIRSLAEAQLPEGGTLLDAGCGEGYYTAYLQEKWQKKGVELYALDVSKEAVRLTAKRLGPSARCVVASVFAVPMPDGAAHGILSLFAPYAEEEFLRLLPVGGFLLRAFPLARHLFSLKEAIYARPVENEKAAAVGEGFSLVTETSLSYPVLLEGAETVQALFEMTPYARKTAPADRAKLYRLTRLETEAHFGLQLWKKK